MGNLRSFSGGISVAAILSLWTAALAPYTAQAASADLTEFSINELINMKVTSVSKKPEERSKAAAAIFVVTQDDIRRSGATSIPEALRMVPGLNVARLDANKWSITSRGFSGRFSNKLLVLIDGRSVYTPLFSGVYWETKDLLLEDVDRIEIIRGPGGALWGANAVNGVINIVTKDAADTQGGLLTLGGGTEEQGFGSIRYGGTVGERGHFRVYSKFFARDSGKFASGQDAGDDWEIGQGGFRIDLKWDEADKLTLQGDVHVAETSETLEVPSSLFPFTNVRRTGARFRGGNVLGRWTHTFADDSNFQLQLFYERWELDNPATVEEIRDTFDLDAQYSFEAGARHEFVMGFGVRYTQDRVHGTDFISLDPDRRRLRLFSAFIQDRIALIQDELHLTVGSKFEYNDFTGVEVQPSLRLAWTPTPKHTLWGAVSRGVRTPSRVEDDVRLPSMGLPGTLAVLFGDPNFDSEELLAFELGYRVQPTKQLALDINVFYNVYDNLRSLELSLPFLEFSPAPIHIALPVFARNNMEAEVYGLEAVLDWKPKAWWRMRLIYTFLEVDLDLRPKTIDIISGAAEEDTPEQEVFLQNSFDLPKNLELDFMLRYVDSLPALGIRDYFNLDVRLGWKPNENIELSLVGQNLLDSDHFEFSPTFVNSLPSQIERGVYGKITWQF